MAEPRIPEYPQLGVDSVKYVGVAAGIEALETQKNWFITQRQSENEDLVNLQRTLINKEEKVASLEQAIAQINVTLAILNAHG